MSRRGRRVPEAAPLLGVVLAFGIAGFGFLFAPAGSRLIVAALALALLYGCTGYGVIRSQASPASAIPPDAVLAFGALAAGLAAGYGIVVGQPMVGLLVAVVALAPPAAYHARYGERVNPLSPNQSFLVAGVAAIGIALIGVRIARPGLGMMTAAIVVLAAADYRDVRGGRLPKRGEQALVAGALVGCGLALAYFIAVGRARTGLLVGVSLLAIGAYFALRAGRVRRRAG